MFYCDERINKTCRWNEFQLCRSCTTGSTLMEPVTLQNSGKLRWVLYRTLLPSSSSACEWNVSYAQPHTERHACMAQGRLQFYWNVNGLLAGVQHVTIRVVTRKLFRETPTALYIITLIDNLLFFSSNKRSIYFIIDLQYNSFWYNKTFLLPSGQTHLKSLDKSKTVSVKVPVLYGYFCDDCSLIKYLFLSLINCLACKYHQMLRM